MIAANRLIPFTLSHYQTNPFLPSGVFVRSPLTESVAQRTIALPFPNALTEAEIDTVVAALARSIAQ